VPVALDSYITRAVPRIMANTDLRDNKLKLNNIKNLFRRKGGRMGVEKAYNFVILRFFRYKFVRHVLE
jgi:hypothetical protein